MPTAANQTAKASARAANLKRSIALGELVDETMRLFHALRQAEEAMHADGELGESERGVLFALFTDGAQSVPGLARMRGRTRQRMLQVVDRLAEVGYVRREKNPASEKSPLHKLTAAGRKKVMGMLRKERRLYENLSESLSPRRLRNARLVLRELRDEILERH
ncbi:MAG: MarR family transcriptional regulator [Leptospirales bacterium]|jgi:DNA-binding MarR family transcriptional regulator